MNVFSLKILALTSMIIDHYGAIFQPGLDIYRIIGRLAFPIYAFLLVEGYSHTRDVKKYGSRLLVFALISELPFDFAFYGGINLGHQNIFFALFIGLVMMYYLDKEEKYSINTTIIWVIGGFAAVFLSVDYSFIGLLYILAFYYTQHLENPQRLYSVAGIIFIVNLMAFPLPQQFSLLALPLIYFYNGKLGPSSKFLQILFYISYPLHLFVFYLI